MEREREWEECEELRETDWEHSCLGWGLLAFGTGS